MEIPRGRGVLKIKILKATYEANWNFLGGEGWKKKEKTFPGGNMNIFGTAHLGQLSSNAVCFFGFIFINTQKKHLANIPVIYYTLSYSRKNRVTSLPNLFTSWWSIL